MQNAVTAAAIADLRALAEQSNAWPFEEARKIVARLKRHRKDEVIFETGYGPSGLPHIGTFGEVARTTMVRHAFRTLTEDKVRTRLIAFSDDMDGLRKVPDNVPNKDMLAAHLGKPLTRVPDPFGTHPSFGAHNNARLRAFLDTFGFDYEFLSATECYTSGRLDAALMTVLARFDAVMEIMLPSLRAERAGTYSPFLPVSPRTGEVLQVPIVARDVAAGTISYDDPATSERMTTPVTGGHCKLQWKPDWAMRWVALGVDYEMAGKDLIDSVKLSGEICRALGGDPPEGFNYELFLDERGQKISKSKGNGLTIEEWLRYASPESLSLFMYREPKAAKRLYFDVIPRHVDEYQQFLEGFERQDAKQRLANPVWHIHAGTPPSPDVPISFTMLLNLVSASNAENAETLWGFIGRYWPGVTPQSHPRLNAHVEHAIHYFRDFVLPEKRFRAAGDTERAALMDLRDALSQLPADSSAEKIQEVVYEVGRRPPFLDVSGKIKTKDGKPGVSLDWFNMLYQVLLGQEKGPRFGSFAAVYGLGNTIEMIDGALARNQHHPDGTANEPLRRNSPRPSRPNEGKSCDAVIKYLEKRANARRMNLRSPEKEGHDFPVEVAFNIGEQLYALEHTLIQPFPGHVEMEAKTDQLYKPIEDALKNALGTDAMYELFVPINVFQDKKAAEVTAVQKRIIDWVKATAPNLPRQASNNYEGARLGPVAVDGVPFDLWLCRFERPPIPNCYFRIRHTVDKEEELRLQCIRDAIEKKFPKLDGWKRFHNAKTIFVMEQTDIQLTAPDKIANAYVPLAVARRDRPDETYLVVSCFPRWNVWPMLIGDKSYLELVRSGEAAYEEINPDDLTSVTNR